MTYLSKKGRISLINLVKLLFWVVHYTKIKFSTKNVIFVFANLGDILVKHEGVTHTI